MKVKELIAKLQEFDGELEVITMEFDGYKECGVRLNNDSFSIQESIRMWGDPALEKALVIG